MSKLVDPIALLKDYYTKNKEIQYINDDHALVFGTTKVKVDSKTAWTKKNNESQYSIGALWYFLKNKDTAVRDYMNNANTEGFEKVAMLDKKIILSYFTGETNQVDQIDKTLIKDTLIKLGQSNEVVEGKDIGGSSKISDKRDSKYKRKIEEEKKALGPGEIPYGSTEKEKEMQVMDYLMKNEKKIVSKNSILQAPGKSFANIFALCWEMINDKERGVRLVEKVKKKRGAKNLINVNISTLKKKQKMSLLDEILNSGEQDGEIEGKPIIVVPPIADHSQICSANAISFFKDGKYIEESVAKNAKGYNEYGDHQKFEYIVNDKIIEFEVYDSVIGFTKSHWRRVVAYFAQAEEWELKDFPPKESAVDIFLKIRGYFFTFTGLQIPECIKRYNIKTLRVSRTQRYEDRSIKKEFWDDLIDFMNKERNRGK